MRIVKNIAMVLFIVVTSILFLKVASGVCSGTDLFSLKIYDPFNIEIQTCAQQSINPTGGINCNQESNPSCSSYVTCQRTGTYTSEIICDSCSAPTHSATPLTTVLTCYASTTNKFVIKDSTGVNIAAFDDKGDIYLKGKNETTDILNPPAGSFIVKHSGGIILAYIDGSGAFYQKGTVQEHQTSLSPPQGSLRVMNSSNDYVAYIDNNGNLVLTGTLYENWLEGI